MPGSDRRLARNARDDGGFYLSHWDGPAQQPRQRGHAPVGDAARHDQVELREVGVHVEREAVARDPARDADADGRELVRRRPRRRSAPARALGRDAEVGRRPDQHLFEVAHVAVHVAAIRPQIDDRIADELAGTVVGDVAAAARLEQLDAARRERLRRGEDVRAIVPRP